MSFLSAFDICGSGLTAQRMRLDIASENITNMETTRTEAGGPYRRKMVVLEEIQENSFRSQFAKALNGGISKGPSAGVRVAEIREDQRDFIPVYNPEHPDAGEDGYVLSATRSYEANLTMFNAIKLMAQKALEIGK